MAMQIQAKGSIEASLEAFEFHLRSCRGACDKTCSEYRRYVRDFLETKFANGILDAKRLVATDLIDFVAKRASRYKPKTAQLVAIALRSFLRFLLLNGLCNAELVQAVPTIAHWRLSQLPATLGDNQVELLLASFDRSTAMGLRDYAMALCFTGLGLRAHEVAQISLDDINWRAGTLTIPKNKTRRAGILPLPPQVGEGIAAYLRRGRPFTRARRVFVRHTTPVGSPIKTTGVRAVIHRAFSRAKIETPSKGTHILRRTAATRMIRQGATLKEIADVLRHESLETTQIYAKVDLPALTEVALPWPEVTP
jgi:site-specific recombinase XerD